MTGFPTSIEDVTAEWLTEQLGKTHGGRVSGFTSERIGEGVGLLGVLDRIRLEWDDPAGRPTSVVAKFATDNEGALDVVKTFNFYEKEVNFYAGMADKTLTRTPVCHANGYDGDNETFVLLLEDVSTGQMGDQVAGATASQVEATVEELTKLHASWWGSALVDETEWIPSLRDPINTIGIPHALDGYHPISSQLFELPDWYPRYRETIDSTLARMADNPTTLCHGDARLDNLFYDVGDDALAVIDWQIILQAYGIFDIAYFMSQSVPIELRRSLDRDVVTGYRDRLIELGVDPPSFDDLWDGYRLASAMCLVYPVVGGGTVDPDDERAMDLAGSMLDRCVTAAEDLDAVSMLA